MTGPRDKMSWFHIVNDRYVSLGRFAHYASK